MEKLLLAIWIAIFLVPASQGGEISECVIARLREVIESTVVNNVPPQPQIGSFGDLSRLMLAQNEDPENVRYTLEHLQLLKNSETDPVMQKTLTALESARNTSDQLVICLISSRCDIGSPAYHVAHQLRFGIGNKHSQAAAPVHRVFHPSIPDAIVIKPSVYIVADLIHEGTHFADLKYIDKWLAANEKLIQKGQKPDPLFQKYVQKDGDRLTVNEGFYLAFSESRAFRAEIIATQYTLLDQSQRSRHAYQVDRTMEAYEHFNSFPEVAQVFSDFGVTLNNFLELGLRLEQKMNQTILNAI